MTIRRSTTPWNLTLFCGLWVDPSLLLSLWLRPRHIFLTSGTTWPRTCLHAHSPGWLTQSVRWICVDDIARQHRWAKNTYVPWISSWRMLGHVDFTTPLSLPKPSKSIVFVCLPFPKYWRLPRPLLQMSSSGIASLEMPTNVIRVRLCHDERF